MVESGFLNIYLNTGVACAGFIYSWLTGVSNFSLLECFALTPNAVGFLGVWMGPPAVAAVGSVQRLRMSAHTNFVALHVILAPSAMQSTPKAGVGRSGPSHFEIDGGKRIYQQQECIWSREHVETLA